MILKLFWSLIIVIIIVMFREYLKVTLLIIEKKISKNTLIKL